MPLHFGSLGPAVVLSLARKYIHMAISFEKVSLTAQLAAYMRQFSDIPFAADVAELLHSRQVFEALLQGHQIRPEDLLWYAPIFELRYKSVTAAIQRSGCCQVLELASGLALRGLAMSQDAGVNYIESDLAGISAEKERLIAILRGRYALADHHNLSFPAINAIEKSQLHEAVGTLHPDAPLAVVNEGLFPYLSPAEMQTVTRNIHDLLLEFSGCWITPDFSIRGEVAHVSEQQREFRRIVSAATGRNMYNNAFDSLDQLEAFLARAGFKTVVSNPLDDLPEPISMRVLGLPSSLLASMRSSLRLWVLTPA
jgi:O-methyltransferase involved in polyketide biosynthesis